MPSSCTIGAFEMTGGLFLSDNPFRLPRHTSPKHYDIELDLDLETFTFSGSVGIDFEVVDATDTLVLNAAEVGIKSARLADGADITGIVPDEETERVTLELGSLLEPGTYRLEIEHVGTINDQLRGLYRSTYADTDGVEHVIATSQCQSTDARRVFPCWDEPDFKATYQTTLIVEQGLEAYSNTAELERSPRDDGKIVFRFAKTMKMSPYLLAFVAGHFEATEPRIVRGTPIRIIVPKGNLHLTEIALENAVFCFEFLSDYYEIPYPGDKLDHIAIPDFAAGAMENVGLITYRDSYLMIDPEKASQAEMRTCLDTIGHEIAHQWFGNLVTMAWWEGAWLNEAFATFMEMKATHAKRPDWKRWLTFADIEVPWAMATDQLASTRPIEFEVTHPEEVEQMFDSITYGKGSAVLHMMDEFVGVENFRRGVGDYLRYHAYGNTKSVDLWIGLDGACDHPVSEIMETWVHQPGFPQIHVQSVKGGVQLSQSRFLIIPDETDTTTWRVPIQLRGSVDGEAFERKLLLATDDTAVEIGGSIDWLVANAGGHGFYRTSYSDELFERLLVHVDELDDNERHALVSDTLACVRAGQHSVEDFFDLAARFVDEQEQAIWSVIFSGLGVIEHHALGNEARPGFETFVYELVGPALGRLGWEAREGESDLERKLRGGLIAAMGNLAKDKTTIRRCASLVELVVAGEHVDPEVATAALAVHARNGGPTEYAVLWDAYEQSNTPLDERRFLRSVASVETEQEALATLDKVIQGSVRSQDSFWVFSRLLAGRAGPEVWERARSQWDDVISSMPGLTRHRVVEGLPALSQPEVAADVKGFFAEHPIPEASRPLQQKLELLEANVKLRRRETDRVADYFRSPSL